MKMINTIVATAAATLFTMGANAAVMDFEAGMDPSFTSGLYREAVMNLYPGSGYANVAHETASNYVAFNGYAAPKVTLNYLDGLFDLNSFVIAGAWGSQTLTFNGFVGGVLSYTQDLFVTTEAQLATLNWQGIDSFEINIDGNGYQHQSDLSGTGQHWALDNVVYNETIASVPAPASLALLGLGLVGLGASRRKKAAA